jgi:aminopeptidase N
LPPAPRTQPISDSFTGFVLCYWQRENSEGVAAMSVKGRLAAAAILAALLGASPARAACGEVVDAACVAREAVEAARAAAHPQSRIRLLSEAAYYLPAEEAGPLLAEARVLADALEDPGFRAPAQLHIAGIMSELGMAEGTMLGREGAAAEQIKRIARFQAMFGDVVGAEIAIGYQRHEADKVDTMFTVAETLATRGNAAADRILRQAMRRLADIDDPARADETKLTAVQALVRMGWVDEALALAETTAEIDTRVRAIGSVVEMLAEAGEIDRAREQFGRIAGLSANDNALWALAMAVARAGGMEEARAMMRDMLTPVMRDQAIGDLAGIQAGQGDLIGALDIFADLPEGFQRNRGLRLVLTALVESGRLEEAGDYAAGLADPGLRNMVIAPIAAARARAGDHTAALATARVQSTPAAQATILLAIAEALTETKKPGQ